MEKKTREQKVATAWETTSVEYWTVRSVSGWTVEYETEEAALKAEEFLETVNWQSIPFGDTFNDVTINLISGHLKYPVTEVLGKYGSNPLGYYGNYEFGDTVGDFRALEVNYVGGEGDYPVTQLIVLTEDNKEQLLDFIIAK